MYHPTLEQVKGMAGRGNLVPIYREIDADLETPVSAYLKVAQATLFLPAGKRRGRRAPGPATASSAPSLTLSSTRSPGHTTG